MSFQDDDCYPLDLVIPEARTPEDVINVFRGERSYVVRYKGADMALLMDKFGREPRFALVRGHTRCMITLGTVDEKERESGRR